MLALRRMSGFALVLLLIEFLDEFVYGAREAAWPLIRNDLGLDYAQIGILLGAPNVIGNLIEPFVGILGDVWRRRILVLGGGIVFALALLLGAFSQSFLLLLVSFIFLSPASGAFVSLSQASLMDSDPARHEQNMARWTFAGSVGVVAGPLALGAATALGLGWRGLFAVFAGLALTLLALAWRQPFDRLRAGPRCSRCAARRRWAAWRAFVRRGRRLGRAAPPRSGVLAGVAPVLGPDAGRAPGISGALLRGRGRRHPGRSGRGRGRVDRRGAGGRSAADSAVGACAGA